MTPDIFPAPRDIDCSHGCCKAGDVGLSSEVVRVGHTRLWRSDYVALEYALEDLRSSFWRVARPACERLLRAILRR